MAAAARAVKEAVESGNVSAREIRKVIEQSGISYLTRRGNIDNLMRLAAVGSMNRGLIQDDREQADWYNKQNGLLFGRNSDPLEPAEEDGEMMVAGDVNIQVSDQESEKPQTPQPSPAVPVPQPAANGASLKQAILSAVAGAGLLGGGIGLGQWINMPVEKPAEKPPVEVEIPPDRDNIGILEPDR